MLIAASAAGAFFTALGAWASVIGISGGVAGFIALVSGRTLDEAAREFVFGSIAATPAGFLVGIAAVVLSTN